MVGEVMILNFIIVKLDIFLQDVICFLVENCISGMLVLDDQEKLVGVIFDIDLMWQEFGVDMFFYVMLLDSIIYL